MSLCTKVVFVCLCMVCHVGLHVERGLALEALEMEVEIFGFFVKSLHGIVG